MKQLPKNYRHITGEVNIAKGESVVFTGGLERDFFALMSMQPSIASIEAQSIRIPYTNAAGRRTRYTPEALIRFKPEVGRKPLLVEVKTRAELRDKWSEFEERFRVAVRLAKKEGWLFRIYTDAEIRTPYLVTVKSLRLHRSHLFSASQQSEICELVSNRPGLTFREALAKLNEWRPGSTPENLSRLYQVIGLGKVSADLFRPIGHDTVLYPEGGWPQCPWSRSWLRSATPPKQKVRSRW